MSGKQKTSAVVSDNAVGVNKSKRKRWIIIAAALLAVLIAGAAAFALLRDEPAKKTTTKNNANAQADNPLKPVEVKVEQLSDMDLSTKVNYLIGTKQYGDAEKLIMAQKDYEKSRVKLNLLVLVQDIGGNKEGALETSAKIAALSSLSGSELTDLGVRAEAAGDKDKAVEYYKKAIAEFEKTKQGNYKDNISRLTKKIEELQ